MTTSAKNSCAFCPTPAHYTSVLHILVHEMQLEALWGNRAFFLKMQLQGESWDNLGELGRAAEICVDLWGSVGSCGEPVLWELLVSRWLCMQSKDNAWTCHAPASDFWCINFWLVFAYGFSLQSNGLK